MPRNPPPGRGSGESRNRPPGPSVAYEEKVGDPSVSRAFGTRFAQVAVSEVIAVGALRLTDRAVGPGFSVKGGVPGTFADEFSRGPKPVVSGVVEKKLFLPYFF